MRFLLRDSLNFLQEFVIDPLTPKLSYDDNTTLGPG